MVQTPPHVMALSGVVAGYGTVPVLTGVDLALAEGEWLAVLGRNGAGKSTLLRVLSGTHAPARGDVELLGMPLASYPSNARARIIAVVGQSEETDHGFSVWETVAMGRAPHLGGWMLPGREDEREVKRVLERLELLPLASRPVGQLSGGEQRRVTIARALVGEPRVLLLDEPGAFLDVGHLIALYEILAEEVSMRKIACLTIVHDLNLACQYANRVALLTGGRLAAVGTVDEVMTYGRLKEAFGVDLYCGENEVNGSRFFVPMRPRSTLRGE